MVYTHSNNEHTLKLELKKKKKRIGAFTLRKWTLNSLNSQTQSKGPLCAKALIWPKPPNDWGWKKGSKLVLVWSSSHSKASHHSDSPFISFMVPTSWLVRGSLLRPSQSHTSTCSRHGHVSLCLKRVLNSGRFSNCNILSFGTIGSGDMFCPDSLLKSFSKFKQSVTLITSRFGGVWMKSLKKFEKFYLTGLR